MEEDGIGRRDLAAQLNWPIDELDALVFGWIVSNNTKLVRTASPPTPSTVPRLQLVK